MNALVKAFLATISIAVVAVSYACPTCIGRLEDDVRPFFMQELDTSTAVDVVDKDDKKNEQSDHRPLLKGRAKS